VWASDLCGREWEGLQNDVIVAKTSLLFVSQKESSDDRALLSSLRPDRERNRCLTCPLFIADAFLVH
jgi:hypothetical protein